MCLTGICLIIGKTELVKADCAFTYSEWPGMIGIYLNIFLSENLRHFRGIGQSGEKSS